jgi:acetoin utilization protein AcuC
LAHLALTTDDMAAIYARLHRLAHETAGGRWVALGGGGYQLVRVVPRAWTMAFAEMTGRKVPIETPMGWRELAVERTGEVPPSAFLEEPVVISEAMYEQAVQEARVSVDALREVLLPIHGVR